VSACRSIIIHVAFDYELRVVRLLCVCRLLLLACWPIGFCVFFFLVCVCVLFNSWFLAVRSYCVRVVRLMCVGCSDMCCVLVELWLCVVRLLFVCCSISVCVLLDVRAYLVFGECVCVGILVCMRVVRVIVACCSISVCVLLKSCSRSGHVAFVYCSGRGCVLFEYCVCVVDYSLRGVRLLCTCCHIRVCVLFTWCVCCSVFVFAYCSNRVCVRVCVLFE